MPSPQPPHVQSPPSPEGGGATGAPLFHMPRFVPQSAQ